MNEHYVNIKVDREERPGRRRGLHGRDDRDDRPGRLADDRGARPRGRAVLRRHLLPRPAAAGPAGVPAGARGALGRLDEPPRRGRHGGRGRVRAPAPGGRPVGGGPARRGPARRRGPLPGRRLRRRERRLRHAPRSSRPRWCWSSCSGTPRGPAPRTRPGWPTGRCARWPAAACTTSSPAASRATRSTTAGWCRTSRRCSTTTRSCSASTPAGGGRPATRWASGSPGRPPTSCSPSCAPTRAGSPRRWTPTPRASRAGSTSGRPPSWSRCSAPTTAPGPPRCSRSPRPARSSTGGPRSSCSPTPTTPERWESVRGRLLAARAPGSRPARDDKVVAAWNGLAVASLAEAGVLLGEPRYVDAAVDAARLIVDRHLDGRHLRRVSRDGVVGRHDGVLEDYACVASGALALLSATGDVTWLWTARHPAGRRAGAVRAPATAASSTPPRTPSRCCRGPATPPTTPARRGSRRWCTRCSPTPRSPAPGRHRDAAEAALRNVRTLAERVPRFAGWSLAAAEAALAGPLEVAVVGADDDPDRDELARVARASSAPGLVVVVGEPSEAAPGSPTTRDGAAAGRPGPRGRPPGGVRLPGDGVRPAGHRPGRPGPRARASGPDGHGSGHGEGEGEDAFPFESFAVLQGPSGSWCDRLGDMHGTSARSGENRSYRP